MTIKDLQEEVCNTTGFSELTSYVNVCQSFLELLATNQLTRIVSPSSPNYIFFQFGESYSYRITRPLNTDLFIEQPDVFLATLDRFYITLDAFSCRGEAATEYLSRLGFDFCELDKVVYTIQQSIGCIGDSLPDANQSRKRIGQLFEGLIRLVITSMGISCEPRTIKIALPGHPDRSMPYELDLVISRTGNVIVASETDQLRPNEIVGSVKTTSKDRLDKVFLDKFLLSRLLGRDVRVIAIFLHDVQRAKKAGSVFGVNSTFKSNHFLGYTIALNRLDGVYYVDRRPIMLSEPGLAHEISSFSRFLTKDIWRL